MSDLSVSYKEDDMIGPWAIIQRFWRRRFSRVARASRYACVVWSHALRKVA
jgi:hypothetical protein